MSASGEAFPLYIVFNGASGAGSALATRESIAQVMASAGRQHEFLIIDDATRIEAVAQQAAAAAARSGGAVVVAGGDGTINAVVQAVLPTGCPLGIVPQGTFNYFSRNHGIPLDVQEATRSLFYARTEPVQVGLVNERVFLVNASLGLYPRLLEDREHYYKNQYGRSRLVAFWSALVTLSHSHRELLLQLEHEGGSEVVRTASLFVGNNPLQLERIGLPEAQDVHQERLAAVIVRPVGTPRLLRLAMRGALGQLAEDANVRSFAFTSMTVQPLQRARNRPVKVAMDGEFFLLRTPLHFRIAPRKLQLLMPAAHAGEAPEPAGIGLRSSLGSASYAKPGPA